MLKSRWSKRDGTECTILEHDYRESPADDKKEGKSKPSTHPQVLRSIEKGEHLIVQERYPATTFIHVEDGKEIQNRFGKFRHKDLIGKPPGHKWGSYSNTKGAGFVNVFDLSPELWTLALNHRTQVLYSHDISLITLEMELVSGCVVAEAGTGSASMSVALARTIAPKGKLISCEFHEKRADFAKEEMKMLALDHIVEIHHRDVVGEGFPISTNHTVDAMFLDLPVPHLVVQEAIRLLKPNGVLATFSPCIEQVQKTADAIMSSGKFYDVRTVTNTLKHWMTEDERFDVPDFGIPDALKRPEYAKPDSGASATASRESKPREKKRKRFDESITTEERKNIGPKGIPYTERLEYPVVPIVSRPFRDMRGHTSYLTFARRIPYLGD